MPQKRTTVRDRHVDELVERVRSGDPRAFGRLVEELEPFVTGSSMKLCRDASIADENVQDTFVNLYRKLHQFDGTSRFSTWLYSIVVNNCRMKRRRRKIDEASLPLEEERMTGGESPEARLLTTELRSVISSAVEALPPDYREVFVLRDLENVSNQETAEQLGLSVAAVKSRLHRARSMVREHVERYLADGTLR